jgi:hypothetical protein
MQWFIPASSYEGVTIPKRMLSFFSLAGREGLEELAKQWADKPRNMIVLASGGDAFTLI